MSSYSLNVKKVIGLTTAIAIFGCSKPTQRESWVNPKIAANLIELKGVTEATGAKSKNFYFSGEKKDLGKVLALSKPDASLNQLKIADTVDQLLKRISDEDVQKELAAHLKDGVITFVVLNKEIKIYKVIPDKNLSLDYSVLSFKYLKKMKELNKAVTAQSLNAGIKELEVIAQSSPAENGEEFGYSEIASLPIDKFGTLENERTDYGERKSILNVQYAPLDQATHIVLK